MHNMFIYIYIYILLGDKHLQAKSRPQCFILLLSCPGSFKSGAILKALMALRPVTAIEG